MNNINTYESIFICPGELSQEKIDATLEKTKSIISRADGKIVTAELWGRRRLSYPIDRNREGFYVYLIFTSPPGIPSLLDRHYRVTDNILRGLTIKVDPRHLEKMRPTMKQAASGSAPSPETEPAAKTSSPSVAQPSGEA